MRQEGVVFGIQRFSIHDGPGIRTLVFFKGCSLNCKWCSNPESQSFKPEILFHSEKCTGCLKCAEACPQKAIRVNLGGQLVFHRDLCQGCGICAQICQVKAREIKGKKMTVQEVVDEVKKDQGFYDNSGGGVTLGGGDPLCNPEFAKSVLAGCKNSGIHTAIETAGCVKWSNFEEVLPYIDLFLFDLKQLNPEIHKEYTGVDNSLILDNLRKLTKITSGVIVRTPIIPGFNDQESQIRAIAKHVSELNIAEYHLLPYHRYGQEKYRSLGREYPFTGVRGIEDNKIQVLKKIASLENLKVFVGG